MGQKIGLDSTNFIYLFERHPRYIAFIREVFSDIRDGRCDALLSSIGLIEIMTGPKKVDRKDLAIKYQEQITHFPNLSIVTIDEQIIEYASDFRAFYGLKTPDAVHIATAYSRQASYFLTNDRALKKVKEIPICMIEEYKKL